VFQCVTGREREIKRGGRERVRGRGRDIVGRGTCMREREQRDSGREGGRERVGGKEGGGGRERESDG
jgi:hypothetical protein